MMDTVRVLRIIEYVGPRELVEAQVASSLHGERNGITRNGQTVVIRAATIGLYPEIMTAVPVPQEPGDGA